MANAKQSEALRTLATIYRFPGGLRSPGEVDIERPVQVVHDVSRAAENLAGIEYVYEMTAITGGAGADEYQNVDKRNLIQSVTSIAARAKDLGLTPTNTDVWLLDVSAFVTQASASDISFCAAALYPPENAPAASELYASMLGIWNTTIGSLDLENAGTYAPLFDGTVREGFRARLPRRVGQLRAQFRDDGTGAATYSLRFLVSILPKGIHPVAAS